MFSVVMRVPANTLTTWFYTQNRYTDTIYVDWGDGSLQTITHISYRHRVSHEYSSDWGGRYAVISITGELRSFWMMEYSSYDEESPMLVAVLTPFPRSMSETTVISPDKVQHPYSASFSGCTGLISAPSNLFKNLPNLVTIYRLFYHCENLRQIPEDLFGNCPNLATVNAVFEQKQNVFSKGLASIPRRIFAGCPNLSGFYRVFFYNVDVTGQVPELWNDFPDATASGVFTGCTNASNYSQIPRAWGGPT